MNKIVFFVIASVMLFYNSIAQPNLAAMQRKLILETANNLSHPEINVSFKTPSQGSILLHGSAGVSINNLIPWLTEKLELRQGIDVIEKQSDPVNYFGIQIQKVQQYYKNIKVEHGCMKAGIKAGNCELIQMEFYSIPDSLQVTPAITKESAMQKAVQFVGANHYAWENYIGNDPNYLYPDGSLVIVEDIFKNIGQLRLAYKFNIYAMEPLSRSWIYVDAITGEIIFTDAIIKNCFPSATELISPTKLHKEKAITSTGVLAKPLNTNNSSGTAVTRYSGTQSIYTDNFVNLQNPSKPYRLRREINGGDSIKVLNYLQNDTSGHYYYDMAAIDFTDNDNNWTDPEYNNSSKDNAALDAFFNLQVISDYWEIIHNRNSWNNLGGELKGFVHVRKRDNGTGAVSDMDNAFWNGYEMYYGDGTYPTSPNGFRPVVSMDISAHEVGHGVCQASGGLTYQRESGALNEGFSDIWGACIENYATNIYSNLGSVKDKWKIGEEITATIGTGFRSMQSPHLFNQPDTYKEIIYWADASVEGCPNPSTGVNDNCWVHTNSGVLNKWFFLVTQGGSGTNGIGFVYNIPAGLGFSQSEKLAYLTELILTPNSGYEAARVASINAGILLNLSAPQMQIIRESWNAVAVYADTIYNMSTNPTVFLTNNFTSIGIGKYGCIWAGTANQGFYRYKDTAWQRAPAALTNHNIADIKTDIDGGIWVAQYGSTGAQANGGGINYFSDSSFNNVLYSTSAGLPTRNVRSLFINNLSVNNAYPWNRIWSANMAHITAGVSTTGAVGRGTNFASPQFIKITNGVETTNGLGSCQVIGGSTTEVWVFASANFGHSEILRYNINTNALIDSFDNINTGGILPAGFIVKAICYDPSFNYWWVGMSNGDIYVYNGNASVWSQAPQIFPAGTIINTNAIVKDKKTEKIYIGSTNGYLVYSPGIPEFPFFYKRVTTADGLPSNNIKGIAIDTIGNRVLLATDNGIAFRYLLNDIVYTVHAGNWNDPTVWSNNKIPDQDTKLVVRHALTVNVDAVCKAISVPVGLTITINSGVKINVQK